MVSAPEVDTPKQRWPRRRTRVPVVGLSQASIGGPHHLLKLPEFAQEAGVSVIDLLCVFGQHGMRVRLDVPKTVGQATTSRTSHFLLTPAPFRKLHFMRKQNTACHEVNEPELSFNGPQSFLGLFALGRRLHNVDLEEIVCVTSKSLKTVGRYFKLPVHISNGRPLVMGVKSPMCQGMVEPDNRAIVDMFSGEVIPRERTLNLPVGAKWLSVVLNNEEVVFIFMGI